MKLFQAIASEIERMNRCEDSMPAASQNARERLKALQDELPSGSGWDCGTEIDLDESTGEKIVLTGSWHHMDEQGGYDGWTEHVIMVTPSLQWGFNLAFEGENRDEIHEYLHDLFQTALETEIPDLSCITRETVM